MTPSMPSAPGAAPPFWWGVRGCICLLYTSRSRPGRGSDLLPPPDVPASPRPEAHRRAAAPRLPEVAESEVSRHYQAMARHAFGVCDGFYPLGSCTMKYNPKLGEDMAALPGFTGVHPLQPAHTVPVSYTSRCV